MSRVPFVSIVIAVAASTLACNGQSESSSTQNVNDAAPGAADGTTGADGAVPSTAVDSGSDATLAVGTPVDASPEAAAAPIESGASGATPSDATDDALDCPPTSCPATPGNTVFQVVDSAGQPVPYPTFLFGGSVLYGTCLELADGGPVEWDPNFSGLGAPSYDAGDAAVPQDCAAWSVLLRDSGFHISEGAHTIGVAAPGYVTTTVSFVVTRSCSVTSICQDPAVTLSVTMTPGQPCGTATCADDEVCIVPCCAGVPACLGGSVLADGGTGEGGTCPAGSHPDGTCTADGTGGCRSEQCTPAAPYCSNDAGACFTSGIPPMDGFVQCNCQ